MGSNNIVLYMGSKKRDILANRSRLTSSKMDNIILV